MQKGKNITRISASDLRKLHLEGKTSSDLARLRAKSEKDIEQDILSDPDSDIPVDWLNSEVTAKTNKERITIRLDKEVIDFFKSLGDGYQTRINDVLKLYVSSRK